jgi:regulatory protein
VPTCYNHALTLLASRPHFRAELAGKLSRRGYPSEEIEPALDRLTERGLLNDEQAAAGFVAGRAGRGEGKLKVAAELRRRGASDAAVETTLAALPDDDTQPALEAARRWSSRGGGGGSGSDPAALARHLARKGFSRRAIFSVLNARGESVDGEE